MGISINRERALVDAPGPLRSQFHKLIYHKWVYINIIFMILHGKIISLIYHACDISHKSYIYIYMIFIFNTMLKYSLCSFMCSGARTGVFRACRAHALFVYAMC